jgi:hypothetical protein
MDVPAGNAGTYTDEGMGPLDALLVLTGSTASANL